MMNEKLFITILLFLAGSVLAFWDQDNNGDDVQENDEPGIVSVISVKGTIGPTTTNYLQRTKRIAEEAGHDALIMELDTPGGLLDSTQDIVQIMLQSELPIIVFVSPEGANAGSAGTFITLAAHIAAMAPATNIGAASPVTMGGGEMDTVAQKKIFNYSESYIESIAEERGRNAEWAKSAVRDGASVTSREALELNVIDLIADNLDDLLDKIHGMEIEGQTLNTRGAEINRIENNLAEIFFSFILRPEVMLILTLIAIYGIVGEVTNPGAIVPGMSGAIALILLLYGVAAMPINIAGFLLMGLAIALFVIEAFTPTYGILLTGGTVSFFLGALMLFQDMPEEMQISLYWLVPATLLTALFFAWIVSYGIKAQFGEHRAGLESLIGKDALVLETVDSTGGRVSVSGEYWNAYTLEGDVINKGERCEIVDFEGLKIVVKPKKNVKETTHG
jgi:membrane-bound serine protease (ClpP class)